MELNLVFLLQSVREGWSHLLCICCSRACVKTFRTIRSLSPLESTQINFDLYEMVGKLMKAKTIKYLMEEFQKNGFKFNEKLIKDKSSRLIHEKLSREDCKREIKNAVKEAQSDCLKLGITCDEGLLNE